MSASPNRDPPPALHSAENQLITHCLLHVLYGTSKDFSSNIRGLACCLHGKCAIRLSHARHSHVCLVVLSSRTCLVKHPFKRKFSAGMSHKTHCSAHESIYSCTLMLRGMYVPCLPAETGHFLRINFSCFLQRETMDLERDLAWQARSSSLAKRLSQEPGWFGLTFAVQEPESRWSLERSVEEKIEDCLALFLG